MTVIVTDHHEIPYEEEPLAEPDPKQERGPDGGIKFRLRMWSSTRSSRETLIRSRRSVVRSLHLN